MSALINVIAQTVRKSRAIVERSMSFLKVRALNGEYYPLSRYLENSRWIRVDQEVLFSMRNRRRPGTIPYQKLTIRFDFGEKVRQFSKFSVGPVPQIARLSNREVSA